MLTDVVGSQQRETDPFGNVFPFGFARTQPADFTGGRGANMRDGSAPVQPANLQE